MRRPQHMRQCRCYFETVNKSGCVGRGDNYVDKHRMKIPVHIHVLVNIIIIAFAFVLFLEKEKDPSFVLDRQVLILLSVFLLNHYLYAIKMSQASPLLSLDVVFLIGLVSMCFSVPLMNALGIQVVSPYLSKYISAYHYSKSLPVALMAALFFSTGFILSRGFTPLATKQSDTRPRKSLTKYFVIPGSLLFLYFLVFAGKYYLSGNYNLVYSVDEKYEVPFFVSQILLTLGAIATVIRVKRIRNFFSINNLFLLSPYYALIIILAIHGDRGALIICMSPLLYLFLSRTPKRYATLSLIIGIVIAMLMIGILRTARNQEERGISTIIFVTSEMPLSESVKSAAINIGSSGLLLSVAMEYQEKYGMTMGRFTLNALLGIFPYSRRFLYDTVILTDWKFTQSADLLTYYLLGPQSTSGVGTSTLADLYLEFGWIGVFIGHFLIGWGAGYIQSQGENPRASPGKRILYIFSIGVFAIMARYSAVSSFVRLIGYALIAIYLVQRIIDATRNRNFNSNKNLKKNTHD